MNEERLAFKNKIISTLDSNTLNEAAIIVNGEYLTAIVNGKKRLVYVTTRTRKDEARSLTFFTKAKDTGLSGYTDMVSDELAKLESMMLSTKLYGYSVPGFASLTKCTITACADNGFLILESQLYASVRMIVESGQNNQSFRLGGDIIEPSMVRELVDLFKQESYKAYEKLLFCPYSRKLLNKLRTRGKFFYGIQNTFIPVFIDYKKVHNPFRYSEVVKNTKLYKVALEKNRVREFNSVSCYYLTQYEVCKALGMKQFMRFTPVFLYQVYVGLLFPDNNAFPAAMRMVYVSDNGTGNKVLSEAAYQTAVGKVLNKLNSVGEESEEAQRAKKTAAFLQSFEKQSSLLVACKKNQRSLTDVGGQGLDTDREHTKSAIAYYNYLKQAELLYD